MGMQGQAALAGELGRAAHEVLAHVERRAWGDDDTHHAVPLGLMEGPPDALAIPQHGLLVLHYRVRRQAAARAAHGHASAAGMQAHADLPRCENLIVERGAVWVKIEMVTGGGAPGEGQFRQHQAGGYADCLCIHTCPYRIVRAQPLEQAGVLRSR